MPGHRKICRGDPPTRSLASEEKNIYKRSYSQFYTLSPANPIGYRAEDVEIGLRRDMAYLRLLKWRGLSQGLALIPPADLEMFGRWVAATKSGDQNELPFVPTWWGEVAADHSDCLGSARATTLLTSPRKSTARVAPTSR